MSAVLTVGAGNESGVEPISGSDGVSAFVARASRRRSWRRPASTAESVLAACSFVFGRAEVEGEISEFSGIKGGGIVVVRRLAGLRPAGQPLRLCSGQATAAGPTSGVAVSCNCSAKVPANMARASSISCWKLCSDDKARAGNNWRRTASPIAPHSDRPVSRASCSRVSIVPLPIPRVGVLMTRSSEIESSGLWMTFRYEIMSLISARS